MYTHGAIIRKTAVLMLTAALIILGITAASVRSAVAEDNDDEGSGNKPELTIEVVEDIPAAEIEEQEVPLADTPYTAAAGNMRNTVISWTIGAILIAYMVFLFSGMSRRKKYRKMQSGTTGDRGSGSGGEVN